MNISRISSKEDCHYFYYSTNGCNKVDCAFRHEVASKGQEKRCLQWLQTKRCSIPACPLRHKVLDKDRAKEPCYFEKDGSCLKLDCPFFHSKPRPAVPTKKIDTVMYCPICKVTSSSPAGHVAHLQGKKHIQKINELRGIPPSNMVVPPTVVPGAKVMAPPQRALPQPQMSAFYCKSCKMNLYTKDKFDAHFQNPPHKKIGGAQALKKTPTQTFHCKVCNQTLRNKFFYDQHMNSPEHRVAVAGSKSLSGSNSSSSLSKLNQQVLLQPPPPLGEIKVGVFWDLENCQLSPKIDIAGVVQKLKKGMQELGMDILPVLNNKKNAADDLLKNKMMSFAENPHCRIILISGDVDFSQHLLLALIWNEKKGNQV